ncbi:MAG: hypothetical protein ACRD3C_22335 [Vicinamibacterales bacterium]
MIAITRAPDIRDRCAAFGFDIVGITSEELQAFVEAEVGRCSKVIRNVNIHAG